MCVCLYACVRVWGIICVLCACGGMAVSAGDEGARGDTGPDGPPGLQGRLVPHRRTHACTHAHVRAHTRLHTPQHHTLTHHAHTKLHSTRSLAHAYARGVVGLVHASARASAFSAPHNVRVRAGPVVWCGWVGCGVGRSVGSGVLDHELWSFLLGGAG